MGKLEKQRLLFVIPTLDRSGAEKQLTLLAAGLPRDMFDVHVAVLTRTGPLAADLETAGIPYTVIQKQLKVDPFALGRLERLIRRLRPDIVHTWLFAGNCYGRLAAIRCGVPRIIAGERCVDLWKSRWQFAIDRYFAKRTERIVTNSSGVVDFYTRNGFSHEQFVVVPNGVAAATDTTAAASSYTRAELLRKLGFSPSRLAADTEYSRQNYVSTASATEPVDFDSPYLIGIIARLWPQKRLKEAVWAADTLKFAKVNFQMLIFGDGPQREQLLRYRDALHLADRVHFLGHRNDLADVIPHLDVLWSTSAYEGQSNSILEAMASGVSVVASDIPGNRDLVIHGETGFLIPEFGDDFRRRRSSFIERTIRLYESATFRKQLGESGKQRVTTEFSIQQMIDRHVSDVYCGASKN